MSAEVFSKSIDLTNIPEDQWEEYIGHGYRNSCYTVDSEKNGQAILFGYDTEGNPQTFIFPHKSWVKYRVRYETDEKDIFGNYVATKYFRNSYERKRWIEASAGIFIVEALRPEQEILHKLFTNYVLDSTFNNQDMRIFYLDIETEISDTFMKPKDALNRINMITIYDTETEKFYTWSLEDAKIDFVEDPLRDMDKSNFVFYSFNNNEIKMMEHFIHFWETNYPDVVCGYNSQAYDLPYIIRRIENILTKGDAARLSPIGKYFIREVNHDNERANVQAEIEVDISGIFSADEMVLYRDKFKVKPALDGGYSLNNVGESEGLGKKIHYSGTLKDLYEKDYQKFYEYNVRDVDLLKRIEEKCKLIPLARRVAGSGLTNYNAIYSSISYLIGSLIAFGKTEMEGSPVCQSYLNEKKESQGYEGAYVFPPVVGLYKGGIACVDFNSLYPSTIRALNLSPETYVGKIIPIGSPNPDDPLDLDNTEITTFYLKPPTGQTRQLSKDELLELCKTKCIFTRNNTLFLKHSVKQGLVSAWSKHFYGLRKSTKKEMQALEMKLYNKEIIDPIEIKKAKVQVENLNNMQMAVKIMLNSIYGILGTVHSPIENREIAQTITRTGKFANMSAATYIKEWFKEKFKVGDDYVTPVSGDTDSVIGSTKIFVKCK